MLTGPCSDKTLLIFNIAILITVSFVNMENQVEFIMIGYVICIGLCRLAAGPRKCHFFLISTSLVKTKNDMTITVSRICNSTENNNVALAAPYCCVLSVLSIYPSI